MEIKIKNKIKVGDQTEILLILFTIIPRKKKWLLS